MASINGLEDLANGAFPYPFARVRELLGAVQSDHQDTIDMTLGEPREAMPRSVADCIKENEALFAKYPPIRGLQVWREAVENWIARRYGVSNVAGSSIEILPLNGSREGLFFAALPAIGRRRVEGQPAIAMCNPYYASYIGAALAVGAEPIYLNATEATGHLPDLDALASDTELLSRLCAFYVASPANPQGAVASEAYLLRALELARQYDFMLFVDECYSEIYAGDPPPGGLEVAHKTADGFKNLVVFNSLSKRSNLPGLRSGFCAGDADFLGRLAGIRNLVAPQLSGPIQHASAAVWADEVHVRANRLAYKKKYDVCDKVLGARFGYCRPDGGFFLWLDMHQFGGGVDAAVTIWQRGGVRVIPGAFLAQSDRAGVNPGAQYVRLALVHDPDTIQEALERVIHSLA